MMQDFYDLKLWCKTNEMLIGGTNFLSCFEIHHIGP